MSPSATMACERRPWMSVTMATPHESDSFSGSYRPWASGNAENSIGIDLRSLRNSSSGTAPARSASVSARARRLPVENGRDQRKPGQVAHHGPGDAATMTTTIAGIVHDRSTAAPPHEDPRQQRGSPTSRKTLSTTAAPRSPCSRSWVIRSPPHAGQFQPVSSLNGQAGNSESGAVRVAETDVGQPAAEQRARPERAVEPRPVADGRARFHRAAGRPSGSRTLSVRIRTASMMPQTTAPIPQVMRPTTQLGDAQSGVAEVDPPDTDQAEQPDQLQQACDDLGLVRERLAGQWMTTVRRRRIHVRRRILSAGGYWPGGGYPGGCCA